MSRLLLCALALMMSVDFRGSASEQRKPLACEKSGICSLGKTRPYTGDISRQGELRKALDARSYKKEVIIITSTSDHRMLPLLLVLDNLAQLGMDHVLILSLNHDSCTSISQHAAAYGCAFYNSSLARGLGLDGAALLWHNRYRTLMRAARLGFNALSTDSDMTFFDDFYHVFKAPPFAEHHVLNQKENLHDDAHFPHVWGPNGGFLYLQNARPDGPSTWLVAEAIGRHLRWRGNRGWWTDGWGGPPNCLMMDQDGLGAVLRSSMLGRPIFQAGVDCLFHGLPDREELRERYKDVSRNVDGLARLFYAKHPLKSVTTSAEWRPYVGADSWHLHGFPIVVPNSGGEWPESLGPNLYPPRPGPLWSELLTELKDDCPACPLWPDAADGRFEEAAAAIPAERFLYLPSWVVTGFWPRGRYGHWNPALLPGSNPVPQQLIGHAHYIPVAWPSPESKLVVLQGIGRFNYTIAHRLLGDRVYYASAEAPLKLVALHPQLVNLGRTTQPWHFGVLLQGLAQVAALTGRTLVWPDVPCNVNWLQTGPRGSKQVPLQLRAAMLPYTPPHGSNATTSGGDGGGGGGSGGGRASLRCMWWRWAIGPCFRNQVKGMIELELAHLKEASPQGQYGEPGPSNTLFPRVAQELHAPTGQLVDSLLSVSSADVETEAARLAGEGIVYVGHPLVVRFGCAHGDAHRRYSDLVSSCPAAQAHRLHEDFGGPKQPSPLEVPEAKLVPAALAAASSSGSAAAAQQKGGGGGGIGGTVLAPADAAKQPKPYSASPTNC